jgi:hypothetical protein
MISLHGQNTPASMLLYRQPASSTALRVLARTQHSSHHSKQVQDALLDLDLRLPVAG